MVSLLGLKNIILKYYSSVRMHNSRGKALQCVYLYGLTFVFSLISWVIVSLFLLEDKQNVNFGGVVLYELYMHFECAFHVFL